MTAELIDLPLFEKPDRDKIQRDLSRLLSFLRGRGARTAREIQSVLFFRDGKVHEGNFRYIRELAEASEFAITSLNSGYILTDEATPEQINEFDGRLSSQVNKMTTRRIGTLKRWHARRAA